MGIAWFIFITFLIVGTQIYIYSRWGLSNLGYTRSFSEDAVFEGEEIEMVDEISNKKLLPVPWLRLEASIDRHLEFKNNPDHQSKIEHGQFHRSLFSLMSYQRVRRKQYLTCTKRGFYRFDTVALATGDVFGFNEKFQSVKSPAEILVYPPLLQMDDVPLPTHSWLGDIIVRRWIMEDPFLTAGVREYTEGDSLQSVNWKATARTNELQVNQHEYTADHHLMIYVNFNQTDDIWNPIREESLIEEALSYAATIADYAIENGISTGFGCNSYVDRDEKDDSLRIEPENSQLQLTYLLETMAKLEVDSKLSMNSFLQEDIDQQREGADILLITAIETDEMSEKIKMIEAQGNSVERLVLGESA